MQSTAIRRKIYELRIYDVKPKYFPEFLALTKEKFGLRVQHSVLSGFWLPEIGAQNQTVHIWEYDSLTHRKSIRDALAKDDNWIGQYVAQVRKWFQKQDNLLMIAEEEPRSTQHPFFHLAIGPQQTEKPLVGAGVDVLGEWNTALAGQLNQRVTLSAFADLDTGLAAHNSKYEGSGKLMYKAPFSGDYCTVWK